VLAKPRKQFSPAFKAKVALEAIKGEKTSTEIGRMFSIPSEPGRNLETAGARGSA